MSFFLSPSLFLSFCKVTAQCICLKPREFDTGRALRFFYIICVLLNLPSICIHVTRGVVEGRAIILDFIGMCMFFRCLFAKSRCLYLYLSLQPVQIPAMLSGLLHHVAPACSCHDFLWNGKLHNRGPCSRHASPDEATKGIHAYITAKQCFDIFFTAIKVLLSD